MIRSRRSLLFVALLVLACVSPAGASDLATVTIRATPAHGLDISKTRAVRVEASSGDLRWTGSLARSGEGDAAMTAVGQLEGNRIWRFEAHGEGLWAPPKDVWVSNIRSEVLLPVWGVASLTGKLKPPADGTTPERLTAWIWPTGQAEGASTAFASFGCTIHKDLSFVCMSPQGEWDLKLRVPGHISFIFWARNVAKNGLALGSLKLRKGASVVGWVATSDGPACAADCAVKLVPDPGGLDSDAQQRLVSAASKVHADEHGFFHFDGVAPGRYSVIASKPGFADAHVFPVDVLENAESTIPRTIVLARPARIVLTLDPALDPFDRPWLISLYHWTDFGDLRGSQQALVNNAPASDGRWDSGGLAPGEYGLNIWTSRGSLWGQRVVELDADDVLVHVAADFVPVVGRLTLKDEPLEATISFMRGRDNPTDGEVSTITTATDENGSFACVLPSEGMWRARVMTTDRQIQRTLRDVPVERVGGNPQAHVDIELPAYQVEGQVVASDQPVPRAIVTVVATSGDDHRDAITLETDALGEFVADALDEGEYVAYAEQDGRRSDRVEFTIAEDKPVEHVVLKLRDSDRVTGRVVNASGLGVAGATVMWVGGSSFATASLTTDLDGVFEAHIPTPDSVILFYVLAPGYALHVQRWNGRYAGFDLTVTQLGGTIVLSGVQEARAEGKSPALFRDGLLVDAGTLGRWSFANGSNPMSGDGGGWAIPRLEPGNYAACAVGAADAAAAFHAPETGFQSGCDGGALYPDATLHLKLTAESAGSR